MLLKLFKIRKNIKEAKKNPGNFVGDQVSDIAVGIVIIPALIIFLGLVLFFLLGFTTLLGGQFWFFKILFVLGIGVSIGIVVLIQPIIRRIKKGTAHAVNEGIRTVKNELL